MRIAAVAFETVLEGASLEALADWAFAFGPTVGVSLPSPVAPPGRTLWVDVTGCAHLHGATLQEGERALGLALGQGVQALGYGCRVALADGPCVAAAVAHHAPEKFLRGNPWRPFVVPPGKSKEALGALPLQALPASEKIHGFLAHLGFRRLGDLQKLPRASLGARLGAEAAELMAFLEGDDRMPLRPYVPCEVPEERAELEYGVQAQEALLFVAKGLCDRMALRLQGRALGACRMELVFQLDAALVPEGLERKTTCAMTMPAPLQSAGDLFAVLKARMERVTLAAPALAVTLRVTEMARREGRSRDLFVPEAKADEALPRLAAELAAELGEGRAGVLCLEDTWVPGKRGRLQAYGEQERKRGRRGAGSVREASAVEGEANKESKGGAGSAGREGLLREEGGLEPSRLLPTPEPVEGAWLAQEEAQVRFHLRLEAVEWWAHGLSVRDYATAWMQGKGLAWVEVDRGTGQCRIMGWVD